MPKRRIALLLRFRSLKGKYTEKKRSLEGKELLVGLFILCEYFINFLT